MVRLVQMLQQLLNLSKTLSKLCILTKKCLNGLLWDLMYPNQTCKKTIFFTQIWFEPKIFYPKKCINYDKSNL